MTTQAKPLSAPTLTVFQLVDRLRSYAAHKGNRKNAPVSSKLMQEAADTIEALTAKQEWDVEKVAEWLCDNLSRYRLPYSKLDRPTQALWLKITTNLASQFTPPSQGWRPKVSELREVIESAQARFNRDAHQISDETGYIASALAGFISRNTTTYPPEAKEPHKVPMSVLCPVCREGTPSPCKDEAQASTCWRNNHDF